MTKTNALENGIKQISLSESSQSESLTISGNITQKTRKNIVQDIIDDDKPLLSYDMQEDAISNFYKLPMQDDGKNGGFEV